MICKNCGKNNTEGVPYCAYCGKPLNIQDDMYNPQPTDKKDSSKNTIKIIAIIVSIFLVIGGGFLLFKDQLFGDDVSIEKINIEGNYEMDGETYVFGVNKTIVIDPEIKSSKDNVKLRYEIEDSGVASIMKLDNKFSVKDIDITVVRRINELKAVKIKAFPFKENEEEVYIYTSNFTKEAEEEIMFIFRKKVKAIIISEEEFNYLLKIVFLGQKRNVYEIIIKDAINLNVSDIHYEPYKNFVVVRFRIDGLLRIMYIFNKEEFQIVLSKIKINSNIDITEKRKPQDGKISFEYKEKSYDLRVSTMPTIFGEKVVIRILYGNDFNYAIENLNFTKEQIRKINYIMKVSSGLTIVNGPTGSGKSTTLYSILQELNKDEINISTLEDPIEAIITGINQMNLNKTLNIGFAEGLRCFLRQDPDIIMLGEIRDEETAKMAVRASLTGHKVYSTIHTCDPREVYFRLEDMGIEKYLIRDSLVGIISQRLIRILCNNCKVETNEKLINGKKIKLYKKCGCNKCNFTGYKGRALVAAIHIINKEMKEKIKNIYNDRSILSNLEMIENLNELLEKGNITLSDYNKFIEMEGLNFSYEKEGEL